MTKDLKDKGRVESLQSHCATLLKRGESWDYIGGSLQLMAADKRAQREEQGLLDFGEDFMKSLDNAARYIEKVLKGLKDAIADQKAVKRLASGRRGENVRRGGNRVEVSRRAPEIVRALEEERARWELVGSYPDLQAEAYMWDGETEPQHAERVIERVEEREVVTNDAAEVATNEAMEGQGGFDFSSNMTKQRGEGDFSASVEEVAQIRERAEADGTLGFAPNGERSKLDERTWCVVRTRAFKRWFGDWEKVAMFRAAVERLGKMGAVAELRGDEFAAQEGSERGDIVNRVYAYWQKFGNVAHNAVVGDVVLDRRAIKDSLGHGLGRRKAAAFAAVREVIEKGVLAERAENWKNRGKDSYVFAAPVKIGEEECVCEVVVMQNADRTGFYLHEVQVKEKLLSVFKTGLYTGTQGAPKSILLDIYRRVKENEESCSKVVDENGEPMVVYHGTPEDFGNVFEDKQPRERDYDPNYHRGTFWFADRRFTAQTYQAKAVFTRYPEAARRLDTEWEHEDVPAGEHADVLEGLRERTVFRAYDTRHSLHGVRVKLSEAFDEDGMLKEDYYVALELKKGEERVLPSGKRVLGRQLFAASRGSNYFLHEGVKPPRTHKEALEFYARFDGVGDRISVPVRSRLYACFLNVRNPKVYDYEGKKFRDMGYRAMEAQAEGHDGVVVQNVYDPGEYPDAVLPGMSIGVFSPGQIKSVDNRGTFDAGNADISFSVRNLAAVHTLSVEKFLAAGKMGGMPLPSVAVTRLDRPYDMVDGWDAIVLVGRPEMVDPARGAQVWSKDAWTGMFPKVTRKLTKEGKDAMRDMYYKMGRYDLKSGAYQSQGLVRFRDKLYDAWQKGETKGDMMAELRSEDENYVASMLFGMERTGWNGALNEAFAYAYTHKEEFKEWLDEVDGKWFGKRMIEGTRKEATLENVTAWMLRNKGKNKERNGWDGTFGMGNARAVFAQRLGSMEEVKAQRENLTDSVESAKGKRLNSMAIGRVFDKFFGLTLNRGESGVQKMQERAQRYFEALGRVKGEPTEKKVEREFQKAFANDELVLRRKEDFVAQGVELIKGVRGEAEDYLEAVPQRAVRMNEWAYAVMDEEAGKNEKVQRVCRENGITPIVVDVRLKGLALKDLIDDGDVSFSVREGVRYRVVDDRVGLSEYLNDVVEPVVLNVKLMGERKDWMKEAREFFVRYLANRVLPIGETGFTLHTDGSNTPRTSAAKVTTERGARAFEKLEEVIGKAVHLGSESPQHREGETKKRRDLMDRSNSVEFFGFPLRVNGGLFLAWFNGTTKKRGKNDKEEPDQKQVRLYEVGFQPVKMKGNALQLTDLKSDAKGVPLTGVTMAEVLQNVNEKSEWMPEVVEEGAGDVSMSMSEVDLRRRVVERLRRGAGEDECGGGAGVGEVLR